MSKEAEQVTNVFSANLGPQYKGLEVHDDNTMRKVYNALSDLGWDEEEVFDAVNSMQNAGILFRERMR